MTIAGMTPYQICWYFMFYSFCGWVVEVMYHAVTMGKVINRGFLNGPVCPVYGFGMLAVIAGSNLAAGAGMISLSSSQLNLQSLILLFLGSMLFATLVELLAGWLLDVNFHMRWWDYSREPFNFRGYICLKFSILWGLSITGVILLIHPMMERSHSFGIPERIGWPILAAMYAAGLADFFVTVAAINGLNKRLEELDSIQKNMRTVSDRLSQTIGESTIRTSRRIGEGQVQAALARAELRDAVAEARSEKAARKAQVRVEFEQKQQELETRMRELEARREALVQELREHRLFSPGRILTDVPELTHRDYREILERLRRRLEGE